MLINVTIPSAQLLTDRESRVPSDRSADASDVPAGYMNRPMRRRRTRPFPPPPMTMNRTKHVSRLREAEDSSDTVQELQTSCGYLATLSADTCSELDDCSAVSGYDSDSTGLKSFSFGSSYARSQSTSYTDEDISTSTTKTHRPIGVSAWSNRSGFELNLNHSSVATRSSRMSGCSAVTDNESFCCVQNRSSSALSPSIKIDTEVDIVVSQILFELAKYDEND